MLRVSSDSAEEQLQSFIDKFEPKHRAIIRAARKASRKRFPTANELAYDNYNFFVIGFAPIRLLCLYRRRRKWRRLMFYSRRQFARSSRNSFRFRQKTRFVRLLSADVLEQPEVHALLRVAAERASVPLSRSGRGKLIIRSVSAKQRPRCKPIGGLGPASFPF
jgi:hypothetical protein